MYTRVVQCTVDPKKTNDFKRTLSNDVLPAIRKQPGFIDVVEMFSDNDPNQFVCMTFWQNKEAVDRYTEELFPTVVNRLSPLLSGEARIGTYTVETSTPHRIAAGKAA